MASYSPDVCFQQSWRRYLTALREDCPPPFPVIVRRVRWLGGDFAECARREGLPRFTIRVAREVHDAYLRRRRPATYAEQVDALLHEWAHAMTFVPEDGEYHTDAWGCCFARVYRAAVS